MGFTLVDGKTKAIPYPQVNYNCSSDYQLAQKKDDPNWGPAHGSLPHCPDFDERFTLADGKTRCVPYPQVGYNCTSDYQLAQRRIQTGEHHMPASNTAQTLMRDSLSSMARPRLSHTHRLITTAPAIINSPRRRMIQTGDQHMAASLIAQTSMRDSPLQTERLWVCHTHRLDTTAPAITNSPKRRIQTGEHHMLASNTAQTSMRDSLSSMARPKLSHTHRLITTAPAITNSQRRKRRTSLAISLAFLTAQTSMRQ